MASGHRIAIVGGGLSGLCAAHALSAVGARVTVYEARDVLGGLCETVEIEGVAVEKYYHHLMPSDHHAIALVHELGLEIDWRPTRVAFSDGARTFPCGGVLDLLRLPLLSLRGRMRYLTGAARVAATRHEAEALDCVPLFEWVEQAFGAEACDRFWRPLIRNRWGPAGEQLSAAWLYQRLKKRMSCRTSPIGREKLGYPRGSFGAVTDALTSRVAAAGGEIVMAAQVTCIARDGGQFAIVTPGREDRVDALVLALPFSEIAQIDAGFLAPYAEEVGALPRLGTVEVIAVTPAPVTPYYWTNVAGEDAPICGIIEHTNFVSPSLYGGKHITYLVRYLTDDDPMWDLSDPDVAAQFIRYLARVAPGFVEANVEAALVFRDRSTHVVRGPGFAKCVDAWRNPAPGVFVANDALAYPDDRGLDVCAMVGQETAVRVLDELEDGE